VRETDGIARFKIDQTFMLVLTFNPKDTTCTVPMARLFFLVAGQQR
jgi:hypothetical protein